MIVARAQSGLAVLTARWSGRSCHAAHVGRVAHENALLLDDPDHSVDESRFVLLGLSASLITLVVCHCYRTKVEAIRIISARKADRSERREYARRLRL